LNAKKSQIFLHSIHTTHRKSDVSLFIEIGDDHNTTCGGSLLKYL
jgi:hypothetical protein